VYDNLLIKGMIYPDIGRWSSPVNMIALEPSFICEGVYVVFTHNSGYHHGDIFYITVKTSTRHKLSHGVHLAFGDGSGYSPGDQWSFKATAGIAARGPLDGKTEITVRGSGFFPSEQLRCRFTDTKTLHTQIVPAHYDTAEQIRCYTIAHPPDSITEPIFHGSGNPGLHVHGIYTGTQTMVFTVRIASEFAFQWCTSMQENYRHSADKWSDFRNLSTSIVPLRDGVFIRFSGGGYVKGDTWRFTAAFNEMATITEHADTDLHVGNIRPAIMKDVAVSTDGGFSWSADQHGLTRFLFSDIYVSPSGNDATGDGTSALPYRTIQRAIQAALVLSPRTEVSGRVAADLRYGFFSNDVPTHINHDNIIVAPGRYLGSGSSGVFPMGKHLFLRAELHGESVIDCQGDLHVHQLGAVSHRNMLGYINVQGVNSENCGLA